MSLILNRSTVRFGERCAKRRWIPTNSNLLLRKAGQPLNKKKDLAKLVEAFIYYKRNIYADIEAFDATIETLDYQQAQLKLKASFQPALFKRLKKQLLNNFMIANQKQFQANQFAKRHYRKLISAKSSLKYFKANNQSLRFYPSRVMTPLDKYQYSITNVKLSQKLNQIYSEVPMKLKHRRKQQQKQSRTLSVLTNKEKADTIQRENAQIFERILAAKSTITEDWKKREKDIKKYRKLSKRKLGCDQQHLFHAYREILVDNRSSATKRRRPATSRPVYDHKKFTYE